MYSLNTQERAKELFPQNPALQQRWESAVNYLRQGPVSKWVLDGQFRPGWNAQTR
jgi:hypothetical protein